MKFNKTTMSLALTAAMFGSVALTQQAFAAAPVPVAAQSSMTDTKGDVLLYPYYTIKNGFRTLFHLVNSSSTDTTIVKVRLRDYKNSEDVLDFTVIMSPNDVFAGSIMEEKQADGTTTVTFNKAKDTTCTAPNTSAFVPSTAITTGDAGHIEVITMATINNKTVIDAEDGNNDPLYPVLKEIVENALHDSDGKNSSADCATVDKYFAESGIGDLQEDLSNYVRAERDAGGRGYRSNLFGHYTIVDFDHGIQGGGRPSTLARVLTDDNDTLSSPCDMTDGVVDNITNICGQYAAHYEFPHLAHVPGVNPNSVGNAVTAAANAQAFRNVYLNAFNLMGGRGIMNEWSKNSDGTSHVESEWVVTLPTKYVLRDDYPASTTGAKTSKGLFTGVEYDVTTSTTSDSIYGKWNDVVNAIYDYDGDDDLVADPAVSGGATTLFDKSGCADFGTDRYDREEQTTSSGTSTSGGQAEGSSKFCNEVATLTFGDFNGVTHDSSHPIVFRFATEGLQQKFGWGSFFLKGSSSDLEDNPLIAPAGHINIPMIGYSMWTRDFGAPGTSYGHIMDHVKIVD